MNYEFDALRGVFIARRTYSSSLCQLRCISAQYVVNWLHPKVSFIQGERISRPSFYLIA